MRKFPATDVDDSFCLSHVCQENDVTYQDPTHFCTCINQEKLVVKLCHDPYRLKKQEPAKSPTVPKSLSHTELATKTRHLSSENSGW